MREQERAPRKYELMTILHPEVEEEALPGELDRIQGYIAEFGGELIESLRESPWGRRRLAYPIRSGGKDVRDGYYTVWHFTLAPSRVIELERELKLNTLVIRYIVVNWEPKPLDPKEIEAAEIAAEDAAAAAYAAAQAAEAATEAEQADEAAAALAAAQASETAPESEAVRLTAAAEAVEATGADLAIEAVEAVEAAIEPVTAVEAREELEAEAAAALEKAEEAAAAEEVDADIPAGAIRGVESGDCPDDYPVKGNASSMLYHTPGSPSYKRTVPEFCFASVEAAEAAGYSPTKYEAAEQAAEESATEQTGAAMGLVAPVTETAEAAEPEAEVPAGAIRGVESGECPDDYPVKGNASSMLYHTPGSPSYKRTVPEFCFASVEAAEAAGFGPTKYEAAQEEAGE